MSEPSFHFGKNQPNGEKIKSPKSIRPSKEGRTPKENEYDPDVVRHWSRNLFVSLFESGKLDIRMDLEEELARLTGDSESYGNRTITPRRAAGAETFLNELVSFLREKSSDQADTEKLRSFIELLSDSFFRSEPNIASLVPIPQALLLTAEATRIPQTRGWLGSELVSQLGYRLNFNDDRVVESVVSSLANRPPETVLDIIDQLQIIAANSLASYEDGNPGFNRAKSIVTGLRRQYASPLIKIYADLALKRIDQEPDDPSVNIIAREGDPLQGRIIQELTESDKETFLRLRNQIDPIKPTPYGSRFIPVASDALGLYDRSNLLMAIGSVDMNHLPPEQTVSMVDIRHLQSALRNPTYLQKGTACEEIISTMNDRVLIEQRDSDTLPNVWHDICKVLDISEWQSLLANHDSAENVRNEWEEYLEQSGREAIARSERVSDRFMERLLGLTKNDFSQLNESQQKYFGQYLDAFREAHTANDLEQAFQNADKVCAGLKWIAEEASDAHPTLPSAIFSAIDWANEMEKDRQQIWNETAEAREAFRAELNQRLISTKTMGGYFATLEKLNAHTDELAQGLLAFLDRYIQTKGQGYMPVDFVTIAELPNGQTKNTFGLDSTHKTTLLLQHLHRPDMRHTMEEKLGLPLTSLGIRAQTAFLEYLARTDEYEFDRLCQFLSEHTEEDKVAIASTFLAFQKEPDFSYIIERICQHEGVGLPVIRHISAMIGNVDAIRRTLTTEFRKQGQFEEINRIHDKLIGKAYDILLRYNSEIFNLEAIQEIEYGGEMLDAYGEPGSYRPSDSVRSGSYDAAKARVIAEVESECNDLSLSLTLFLNTFKSLRETDTPLSLENINELDWQGSVAGTRIPVSDREMMRSIYADNYADRDGYSAAFRKNIVSGLDTAFGDSNARFYVLKRQGKIIAFARFGSPTPTQEKDRKKYFGSFNVAPEMRGSKLGEVFLETCLRYEQADGQTIEALADPVQPISQHYLEKDGFVATDIEPIADRPLLAIELDTKLNARLLSKRFVGFTPERIKELADRNETPRDYLQFKKFTSPSAVSFPGEGWLMTRYLQEPDGTCYAVFEQDPGMRRPHPTAA